MAKHKTKTAEKAPEGAGVDPEKVEALYKHLTTEVVEHGKLLKDALHVTDEAMEGMYAYGYGLYNQGDYDKASDVFEYLTKLNPYEYKYILGVGAARQLQKSYLPAASAYLVAALMEPKDPTPHYHAAECYLELDDPFSAYASMEFAIKAAGSQKKFADLKKRAVMTRDTLESKLEESAEEEKKSK